MAPRRVEHAAAPLFSDPGVRLDPALVGGYRAVGTYALGLSVYILTVSFLAVAATRLPALRTDPAEPS